MSDTVTCFRCGYDLRGVADAQPCPECGLLAERSRRRTDALRDARPTWLRGLSLGLWLILLALVAGPAWMISAPFVLEWIRSTWPGFRWQWQMPVVLAGIAVPLLLLPSGAWLLTRPEGYPPADEVDRRRRKLIRLLSRLPALAMIVILTAFQLWPWTAASEFAVRVMHVLAVCMILFPLMGFRQFRSLARRAGSRHLEEHCQIVGIGASATIVIVAAGAEVIRRVASNPAYHRFIERSTGWIVINLVVAVSVVLFWLWTLYVMVRFAVSFGRAAGEAKRAWRAADLAAEG